MRLFHNILSLDKETSEKIRWVILVEGVPFQLYIHKDRVPKPVAEHIEVSIFSDKSLFTKLLLKVGKKTVGDLSKEEKSDLNLIGLDDSFLEHAGSNAIIGGTFRPEAHKHTETIRYNAGRYGKELQFGDPYVPISLLPDPYPERLLFLVGWRH